MRRPLPFAKGRSFGTAVAPPSTNTDTPLRGMVGNMYFDGFGLASKEFTTAEANKYRQFHLNWGYGMIGNTAGAGNFATSGAWLDYVQAGMDANPQGVDADHSNYVNCMEKDPNGPLAAVLNRPGAPTASWTDGAQNRGLTGWVLRVTPLDATHVPYERAGAWTGTCAVNLTSSSPRLSDGRHVAEYIADYIYDSMFGHLPGKPNANLYGNWGTLFAAPDNCFGSPATRGDWRNVGVDQNGNDGTRYTTWPIRVTTNPAGDTIAEQWRWGVRLFYDRLRARSLADGRAMKITPNIQISDNVLEHAQYRKADGTPYIEWGLVEACYLGPYRSADAMAPTWTYEYGSAAPGSPNAAFNNGTAFKNVTLRLRTLISNTIEKRAVVNVYASHGLTTSSPNRTDGDLWYTDTRNWQDAGYCIAACLMSNGAYSSFNPNGAPTISGIRRTPGYSSGPIIWDEWKIPIGIPESLTEPADPLGMVLVGSVYQNLIAPGVWGRKFTNGFVLVNATTTARDVDLTSATITVSGVAYANPFLGSYKLPSAAALGLMQTAKYTGDNVTSVTLPGKSGLFLLKR